MLEVARFTLLTIVRMRAWQMLCALVLAAPVLSWTFGAFFMVDIAKVHRDLFVAVAMAGGLAYVLLIVLPLFASDMEGGALPVLAPPMRRRSFLLGRFFGAVGALGMYLLCAGVGAAALTLSDIALLDPYYREGTSLGFAFLLPLALFYQLTTLVAAMLAIASFASGRVEASVFGLGFLVLVWAVPAALAVLTNPEVAAQTPLWLQRMLALVAWLFPLVSTGDVLLALTRGLEGIVSFRAVAAHLGAHLAYTAAMLILGLRWFERRPL